MNAAVRSLRQAEVDARLRSRIEKLQRLVEASASQAGQEDDSSDHPALGTCFPPKQVPAIRNRPLETTDGKELDVAWAQDRQKPLVPFPGYPNAAVAHLVEECIGLNLLGAGAETRDNVLRELQVKLSQGGRYTYVCVTDSTDFSYFIQRGITFEYIGYLHRLGDPKWRRYFELNIDLLKKKYGLRELIPAGDPKYVV
jgi:hypothetical protein